MEYGWAETLKRFRRRGRFSFSFANFAVACRAEARAKAGRAKQAFLIVPCILRNCVIIREFLKNGKFF
jgi:hypothetical protein